ncbi:MAG: hypothetical protein GXP39_09870 [Chloroflexi bacterium]|nr:hypothetical protein [Chloroflexota bacterium]
MKAIDILSFWREHKLDLGEEEGFRFGSPDAEVTGILIAWMATEEVIRKAHEQGCNLLIVHEDLLFPPGYTRAAPERYLSGVVNTRRLQLLARWEMTVFRAHGTLDRLCILDDFIAALGLPPPVVSEEYWRVCEIPPTTVGELADRIKEQLALPSLRVVGELEQVVQRVGLPWGGLGLSLNASFLEGLLRYGVDALIAGETDEYAMWAMRDAGIPLIETSHAVSEEPGLRHVARLLAAHFPQVPVHFQEMGRPWRDR